MARAQVAEARDEHARVWAAMELLAPEPREELLLRYTEGCSLGDIATYFDKSSSLIKSHLHMTREKIRDLLDERRTRSALRSRRLGKEFRKRVMGALPLVPAAWRTTEVAVRWHWLGWGAAGAGLVWLVGMHYIGDLHYTGEEYTVALEWYGKVYQRWPDSADAPEALYGAAWCALEMKDQEGMQELFLRLAREHPDHLRAHQGLVNLGDYYYNEARFAKATGLYEEVSARFPETQEAVQAQQVLLYLSDVEADSLYQQGMALFDSTEYEQAIPVLKRVIEDYPGTPSEAAARCNIGVAHQMMSEHRKATAIYREAIAVLEKREEEWRALAFARENLKWIAENIMSTSLEDVLASP